MDSVEDNSTQIDVNNTVSSVDEGGDWDEIDDDTLLGVALSIDTDVCEITDKNCENGKRKCWSVSDNKLNSSICYSYEMVI